MNATLTKVRANTYRINHPATNAAITRRGGVPTVKLGRRLLKAVGQPDAESVEFRRGLNTRKWYFHVS